MKVTAGEQYVKVLGRTIYRDGIRYLGYSCTGIEFVFTGTKAEAVIWSNSPSLDKVYQAWVAVFVDDEEEPSKRFPLEKEDVYVLYEGTVSKETKIRLVKYNEASFGKVGIKEIITDGEVPPKPTAPKTRKLEFIGDSITCGYGIEGKWMVDIFETAQENPWNAYAARTARALDADYHLVSWSGIGIISNYTEKEVPDDGWLMPPLYPCTDKAMDLALGNQTPEIWDNSRYVPDCIVINLGTNDQSYTKNIPERVAVFGSEYYSFVKMVRSKNPSAEIICSLGIMGQDLCPEIKKQVERMVAEGDMKLHFLQYDVQEEQDGIGTDWHPSLATHIKAGKKLEQKIKEIMI